MARPKLNIDESEVEKLASYGCTNTEIADFFNCDEGTIRGRFSEILTKTRADLKKRLRKKQVEVAESGNVTMLIWLGKQMLEQTDKQEMEHKGELKVSGFEITRAEPQDVGNTKASQANTETG